MLSARGPLLTSSLPSKLAETCFAESSAGRRFPKASSPPFLCFQRHSLALFLPALSASAKQLLPRATARQGGRYE
jgi:hypothetical protein